MMFHYCLGSNDYDNAFDVDGGDDDNVWCDDDGDDDDDDDGGRNRTDDGMLGAHMEPTPVKLRIQALGRHKKDRHWHRHPS